MVQSEQSRRKRIVRTVLVLILGLAVLQPLYVAPAAAIPTQNRFQDQIVFQGLNKPTNIEFAPAAGDGRVFVAEKDGLIRVFDSLAATKSKIVADLREKVHSQWDRGLIGLAISPAFPATPEIYVAYTYGVPLKAGQPEQDDDCSGTGGRGTANNGKCVVSARLSRLTLNSANVMTSETVLIEDWCQQYPSHSIGDIKFGDDGYLYVSGGDGASFGPTDYGQLPGYGTVNLCEDPPGGAMTPPAAEGGSLRSQDVRTLADPTSLDGAVLRLDPLTGDAAPGNPLNNAAVAASRPRVHTSGGTTAVAAAAPDANARRIIAYGLRNPYHFTFRPGTNELWIGDVGAGGPEAWEEINRVVNPTAALTNFGWPCYAGPGINAAFGDVDLNLCESLYTGSGQTSPYYTYKHKDDIVPNEGCGTGGDSITGLAFYPPSGGDYPSRYRGALFFTDYSRGCIWAMKPDTVGGLPSPGNIELFAKDITGPSDLAFSPDGELYFTDLGGGTIRRIRYYPANQAPVPSIAASAVSGGAPLTVEFDGSNSGDADPSDQGRLTYEWDFQDDGTVDARTAKASFTYTQVGTYTARLTVKDTLAAAGTATVSIHAGLDVPTATMDTPVTGLTWAVDQTVAFSGHATDPEDGALGPTQLNWTLWLYHCATLTSCHKHYSGEWQGASGTFKAPDHEYPSYVELELNAVDADGNHSVVVRRLYPKTVNLTFVSVRPGVLLTVGGITQAAPFTRTVIQGSSVSISAASSQLIRGPWHMTTINFSHWSDGLSRTDVITAPTAAKSYKATYTFVRARRVSAWAAGSTTVPGLRGRIPRRVGVL